LKDKGISKRVNSRETLQRNDLQFFLNLTVLGSMVRWLGWWWTVKELIN